MPQSTAITAMTWPDPHAESGCHAIGKVKARKAILIFFGRFDF
jgi:hypothetical protein